MATRFYFTTGAAQFTPAIQGTWHDSTRSVAHTYHLGLVKVGANASMAFAETSATNNYRALLHRHVSPPLTGGSIPGGSSGLFIHTQGRQESGTTDNMTVFIHVYFTVGDTNTVRGTYVNNFQGATEFATTPTILSYNTVTPTAVTIQSGDRLVIEAGYNAANTSTTSRTGTMWIGGTAADLATSGTTGITTNCAWFEFTGTGADAALVPLDNYNQGMMAFFPF